MTAAPQTAPAPAFALSEVGYDGTHVSYHCAHGDAAGTPVVLLHPWFGCWQFWSRTVALAPARPVIAVDFYSLGGGDWSTVTGPAELADAVIAVLEHEGIDQADIVGNSVGGIVSQVIAARRPDLVRRLVLIGTGASTEGALPGFAAAVDRWIADVETGSADRKTIASVVDMLHTGEVDEETRATFVDAVGSTDPAYIAQILSGARALDLRSELGAITAPTLVVRGSQDCARSQTHVDELVRGIPDARAVEISGAGHSPMVDHPVEMTRLIVEHLDRD